MNTGRLRRILVPSIALLLLTLGVVFAGLTATGVAGSAPRGDSAKTAVTVQTADALVEFGDPVRIAEGERVEAVVAFGGDVTVAGTVTNAVIAFGGDVRLLATARVGEAVAATDPSVVAMGGTITVDEGAQVNGQLERIDEANWSRIADVTVPSIDTGSWVGFSFLGWLIQTAFFLILGLIAAALLPKQMTAVNRSLAARPGASLGWGALAFFLVVPAAAIVLLISIVGILILIPALVVVPLFYFFASLCVAVFIVQRLLARSEHGKNLMLVTAIGVVATTIISRIPFAGGLALLVMILFGTGAAFLAVMDWRRNRRSITAPAPAGGPAGYAPAAPAGGVEPYPPAYGPAPNANAPSTPLPYGAGPLAGPAWPAPGVAPASQPSPGEPGAGGTGGAPAGDAAAGVVAPVSQPAEAAISVASEEATRVEPAEEVTRVAPPAPSQQTQVMPAVPPVATGPGEPAAQVRGEDGAPASTVSPAETAETSAASPEAATTDSSSEEDRETK